MSRKPSPYNVPVPGMDEQTCAERADIVWTSDALCEGCGADPKDNEGAAIFDPAWYMDMTGDEAVVRCPLCW